MYVDVYSLGTDRQAGATCAGIRGFASGYAPLIREKIWSRTIATFLNRTTETPMRKIGIEQTKRS